MRNIFHENWAARVSHVAGTVPAEATYGNWIDVTGFREISFVAQCAALDGDCLLQVVQNDAGEDSGAVVVTGATDSFVNGTDEDRAGIISLSTDDLAAGNNYVALRVTPANALNFFGAMAYLGSAYRSPVANGTAENIAWVKNV